MSKAIEEPEGELIFSYIPTGTFKLAEDVPKEYRVYKVEDSFSEIVVYGKYNDEWVPNPKMRQLVKYLVETLTEFQKQPEPKCETCGGSGRVPSEYGLTQCSSLPISSLNTKRCPDCKPEPTELSKSFGRVLDAVVVAFATTNNEIIQQKVQDVVDQGRRVCTEIDRQAAELKEKDEQIERLTGQANGYCDEYTKQKAENKWLKEEIIQLKTQMFPNELERELLDATDKSKALKGKNR